MKSKWHNILYCLDVLSAGVLSARKAEITLTIPDLDNASEGRREYEAPGKTGAFFDQYLRVAQPMQANFFSDALLHRCFLIVLHPVLQR